MLTSNTILSWQVKDLCIYSFRTRHTNPDIWNEPANNAKHLNSRRWFVTEMNDVCKWHGAVSALSALWCLSDFILSGSDVECESVWVGDLWAFDGQSPEKRERLDLLSLQHGHTLMNTHKRARTEALSGTLRLCLARPDVILIMCFVETKHMLHPQRLSPCPLTAKGFESIAQV